MFLACARNPCFKFEELPYISSHLRFAPDTGSHISQMFRWFPLYQLTCAVLDYSGSHRRNVRFDLTSFGLCPHSTENPLLASLAFNGNSAFCLCVFNTTAKALQPQLACAKTGFRLLRLVRLRSHRIQT